MNKPLQLSLILLSLTLITGGYFYYSSHASKTQTGINLEEGLVGHWTMEDGTGSHLTDHSGNNNNGTLTNMEEEDWVDGKLGQALEFDGSNEVVLIDDNFGAPETASISIWFKTVDSSIALFGQSDIQYPGSPLAFVPNIAIKHDGKLRGEFYTGSVTEIVSNNTYNDGNWHHVVLVGNDGGTPTELLYIDGVLEGSRGNSDTINSSWWNYTQIGTGYDHHSNDRLSPINVSTWREFSGSLDDVRIYNRALSQEEVQELYEMGG